MVWNAHPDWYDYVHSIEFQKNGNVEFMEGGGQVIDYICGGRWKVDVDLALETSDQKDQKDQRAHTNHCALLNKLIRRVKTFDSHPLFLWTPRVVETGKLSITYGPPKNEDDNKYMLVLDKLHIHRYVHYIILKVDSVVPRDFSKYEKQLFHYILVLDEDPFPRYDPLTKGNLFQFNLMLDCVFSPNTEADRMRRHPLTFYADIDDDSDLDTENVLLKTGTKEKARDTWINTKFMQEFFDDYKTLEKSIIGVAVKG